MVRPHSDRPLSLCLLEHRAGWTCKRVFAYIVVVVVVLSFFSLSAFQRFEPTEGFCFLFCQQLMRNSPGVKGILNGCCNISGGAEAPIDCCSPSEWPSEVGHYCTILTNFGSRNNRRKNSRGFPPAQPPSSVLIQKGRTYCVRPKENIALVINGSLLTAGMGQPLGRSVTDLTPASGSQSEPFLNHKNEIA